ncbi:hypothetical protein [Flavobacterium agrisoli]|uniref:Uncharacterized protein n=1 Tax=Flavobacterium agrisoli TaxID=2793066 RepID=A0A934PNK2_9FLAO|nr:hypothetical protein [Flavobacterium agrisoli]MBK0369703.1 hypothetical protein [Flavobacterium agrisoli]
MKTKIFFIALLSAMCLSCDSDEMKYESQFEKSFQEWQKFKTSADNSYAYTVTQGSWVGITSETTLVISGGKIVQREFILRQINYDTNGALEIIEEWTEDEANLGSHKRGADLLTLDEVYHKAQTDWLLKREGADTYFQTKNNGLISSCGYSYQKCADDCFVGINITNITSL